METVDEFVVRTLPALTPTGRSVAAGVPTLQRLFAAQVQSRHLDLAARWLQSRGRGYYTIGSAGHEANAALGLMSRIDDPALLHYRSGALYAARAALAGTTDPVRDILLSLTSARSDPMSGGRHKVFGHPALHIVPQTSTIASHLPRAVGLAYALRLAARLDHRCPWPTDAVVICSFGDASANHSTAVGAFNAAAYLTHRGIACPVLFVCEDNRIGISTPSPPDWPAAPLRSLPGVPYTVTSGDDPDALLATTAAALDRVRTTRRPGVLHLRTVRFMGHAGSDAEIGYRTRGQILADYDRDPLVATAQALVDAGAWSGQTALDHYEATRRTVMAEASRVLDESPLTSRESVIEPIRLTDLGPPQPSPRGGDRARLWPDGLPEDRGPLTLAQSINATLTELLDAHPQALVLGQDVAVKGGVYGVTRGLRRRFGGHRVFDTLLDEQTIVGTALGAALAGFLPIPEISYLAYLHNAEDQLRGEAASLSFFSAGHYRNGMVVRIAGLAYQRGFGGHFHNDNSVAVLRDIPGLVLAVPSHPADAPGLLRGCVALARDHGRVCVYLEPIALYHTRDLSSEGDRRWTARYRSEETIGLGEVALHGHGGDLLLVTFGNGVHQSRRAAQRLAEHGVRTTVLDLRWLAPLPAEALVAQATGFDAVLVVDETRRSGGVAEGVLATLIDAGYAGRLARVASADSFIPLGPAAATVLLGEDEIVAAALALRPSARTTVYRTPQE